MLRRLMEKVSVPALCAVIVLLCVAVYAPRLSNRFVSLDDGLLITNNPAVQELTPRSVAHVFTSYDPELYVPLTLMSYQVEDAVFGLRPGAFHLTNLVLHALNALLVLAVVAALTRNRLAGFVAAALFAVHPLNVEAVLWASARKDLLSGFFFLASLALYLRSHQVDDRRLYWGSVAAFFLGLLSKVSILLLPVVLVLADVLQGRRLTKNAWLEKAPYVLLSAVFGVIAIGGKSQALAGIGPMEQVLLSAKSAVFYLGKLFVPGDFSPIYPQTTPVTVASPEFFVPVVTVAVLAVTAFVLWRKHNTRLAAFGIALFLLMLLPAFSTFYKNGFLFFASDRYAYLASIGIFLLAGSLVALATHLGRAAETAAASLLALVLMTLGGFAFWQGATWYDSETLYRHVLSVYPQSALAHTNLADALRKSGQRDEAETEIRDALRLDPGLAAAHVSLALLLKDKGDGPGSISELKRAVAILEPKPRLTIDEVPAYYLLAEALELAGKPDEALAQFRRASQKAPDFAETHYNLGIALQKHGRNADAIAPLQRAIELDPRALDARYHLAAIFGEQGRLPEALAQLEAIVAMDPAYQKASEHLQRIRVMLGR